MELQEHNLSPREQVLVSLYLKSMNKVQSARDAGYASTTVFNKPPVKAAIADQLTTRAKRLSVGADWVLMELMRVHARCMEIQKKTDLFGQPTGETSFDAVNALRALTLIGKHVDIKAFDVKDATVLLHDDVVDRLKRARSRQLPAQPFDQKDVVVVDRLKRGKLRNIEPPAKVVEPPSFMGPPPAEVVEPEPPAEVVEPEPPAESDHVVDLAEPEAFLSDEEKLELLMDRWKIGR